MANDPQSATTSSLPPSSTTTAEQKASSDGHLFPRSTSPTSPKSPRSFPVRIWDRTKDATLRWIDYEPHVVEAAPVEDWLHHQTNGSVLHGVGSYLGRLFPIKNWIWAYNLKWFVADAIAGITVCLVLVPQSMSYAKIATLSPEYGLYSSFVGVMVYCLFATSKDVSVGPVAVMSLEVARVISHVQDKTDCKLRMRGAKRNSSQSGRNSSRLSDLAVLRIR
ncbi:hypothetical protein JCM11641_002899 [Rhodosporidiobolus odoratus]